MFAESPNRVFILQRGELPNIQRPKTIKLPQLGPNIEFPNRPAAWRDATSTSPPGRARSGTESAGDDSDVGKNGVDFNWAHCIVVVDANGNHIEDWTQWDKMLRRPHAVYISPYDPEKNVWIVDDYRHAIFKFSNDGKKLLQTIGEPNVHASDDKHFYRPTFMAWLPDGTFFVSDGYANTRVVKFDKNGKYLMAWGEPGSNAGGAASRRRARATSTTSTASPSIRRPGRSSSTIAANHRAQVFDENGKFLREWSFGPPPSDIHLFIITSDRYLWAADRGTSKMLKYDLNGNFQYTWGTWGDFPGGFWGVHGLSVDQEGNFYIAEVDTGRAQKYRPRRRRESGVPAHKADPRRSQRDGV